MGRSVRVNAGNKGVSLSNGRIYDGPVTVTLTDEEWSRLSSNAVSSGVVSDLGAVTDPGGGLDEAAVLALIAAGGGGGGGGGVAATPALALGKVPQLVGAGDYLIDTTDLGLYLCLRPSPRMPVEPGDVVNPDFEEVTEPYGAGIIFDAETSYPSGVLVLTVETVREVTAVYSLWRSLEATTGATPPSAAWELVAKTQQVPQDTYRRFAVTVATPGIGIEDQHEIRLPIPVWSEPGQGEHKVIYTVAAHAGANVICYVRGMGAALAGDHRPYSASLDVRYLGPPNASAWLVSGHASFDPVTLGGTQNTFTVVPPPWDYLEFTEASDLLHPAITPLASLSGVGADPDKFSGLILNFDGFYQIAFRGNWQR